jgi:Flp pilus assembly protein CpaB
MGKLKGSRVIIAEIALAVAFAIGVVAAGTGNARPATQVPAHPHGSAHVVGYGIVPVPGCGAHGECFE